MVTSPDTPRYVFRNESILPFSLYEVKVGVYNNKGEGPFSPVTTVFSAEEGMERLLMICQLHSGVKWATYSVEILLWFSLFLGWSCGVK